MQFPWLLFVHICPTPPPSKTPKDLGCVKHYCIHVFVLISYNICHCSSTQELIDSGLSNQVVSRVDALSHLLSEVLVTPRETDRALLKMKCLRISKALDAVGDILLTFCDLCAACTISCVHFTRMVWCLTWFRVTCNIVKLCLHS